MSLICSGFSRSSVTDTATMTKASKLCWDGDSISLGCNLSWQSKMDGAMMTAGEQAMLKVWLCVFALKVCPG